MPRNRLESLDSLRGIAALSVVFFHYTTIVHRFVGDIKSPFEFPYGYYGVELFFIISGFVIFMTISRCKTGMDFVISRFSRLYPAFWTSVLITYLVGVFYPLKDQIYTVDQLLFNMTMLQEYLKQPNIDGVYWSLTYELGFYFAIYGLYLARLLNRIDYICVFWSLTPILFYSFSVYIPHPLHYLLLINSYAHLFAAGICFYQITSHGLTPLRASVLIFGVISQFVVDGLLGAGVIIAFFTLFYLAVNNSIPLLKNRILVFFGTISYPLYLIHQMVGFKVIETLQVRLDFGGGVAFILTTLFIILLATVITYTFDKPGTLLIRNSYKQLIKRRADLLKQET